MIARLTVVRGATSEYPLAERVNGGWQNGVTFYPDAEVTKVTELHVSREHGHAAEALATLGRIRGVDEVTNQLTLALDAQVHATLALVEQQRIANLIAFHDLSTRQDQSVLDETAHARIQRAGAEIREALGLS